ncbi:MAG: hypothetical protein APF80_06490 [Alphaproteobacteria bacterium BRH_c36]|nr:MAG: hypothetical protein APF80_06490 [Alphaproteobacteria bacterium BRH_c36]
MHGNDFFHSWGNIFSGPIIVIVLVFILFVIWAGGKNRAQRGSDTTTGDPREILDQRFARGEIDEDEYLRKRATLDS